MNAPVLLDEPQPVKLTVSDFLILDRAGALNQHRRAELIDGAITQMSPLSMRHAVLCSGLIGRLQEALRVIDSPLRVLSAPTVALPPHDAPEPDIVVSVGPFTDDYATAAMVALVLEVAVSTLRHDLTTKREIYARAELPEYWVVDASGEKVHQFWSPAAGVYAETRVIPLAGELRSATLVGLVIDGSDIL